LRHIDEGVRAIHISLTLPLHKPLRCIAHSTPDLGPARSATASIWTP
jgi:hypothetical protein